MTQAVWKSILSNVDQIDDSTDFFKSGAASMDVVRCALYLQDVAVDILPSY